MIGYTCGVFDKLHNGHVNILRRAASLCDKLIVAVTTDECCKTYKNIKPIQSYEQRKRMVESIKGVHLVIPQHDLDKFKAWEKLKFDKLFVDDGWHDHPKWKTYEARLNDKGVPVIYFPRTRNISSSLIRNQMSSYYLAYQWVPNNSLHLENWHPHKPSELPHDVPVNEDTATEFLKQEVKNMLEPLKKPGILLSAGMDSLSIAKLLPKGTKAYFVHYPNEPTCETPDMVQEWCKQLDVDLTLIPVTRKDYQQLVPSLIQLKNGPLHPAEVGVHMACRQAVVDGVDGLFTGFGCDIEFGGLDAVLSNDFQTKEEFFDWWCYVKPDKILSNPTDVIGHLEQFETKQGMDVMKFLKHNYGGMTNQSFFHHPVALGLGQFLCPWGKLKMDGTLDMERIRSGNSKYIVRKVFRDLFGCTPPEKIAFTRPDYSIRPEKWPTNFNQDIVWEDLSKQEKWMVYQLSLINS